MDGGTEAGPEDEDETEGGDGVDVIHFYHEPDYPVGSPAHA